MTACSSAARPRKELAGRGRFVFEIVLSGGKLSEQVSVDFERFVRGVHAKLPQTRILYIGIKPSPLRWLQVDRMRLANDIMKAICQRDDRLAYLDLDNPMLGWDEKPRRDLYVEDGLHLSPQGYQLWTAAIRPYLVGTEATESRR